jgi:SRSO17 transposase
MVEAAWAQQKLDEVMARLAPRFARSSRGATPASTCKGLMSDLPRKNCWQLAEHAGRPSPDRMQWLLERARWDAVAAMDSVRDFAVRHLADNGLTVGLDEAASSSSQPHCGGQGPARRLRRRRRQVRGSLWVVAPVSDAVDTAGGC